MRQHDVPALRQFIGPGKAAIIFILMLLHQRMQIFSGSGDLAESEIFVQRMIVQCQHSWKFSSSAPGFSNKASVGGPYGSCQLNRSMDTPSYSIRLSTVARGREPESGCSNASRKRWRACRCHVSTSGHVDRRNDSRGGSAAMPP